MFYYIEKNNLILSVARANNLVTFKIKRFIKKSRVKYLYNHIYFALKKIFDIYFII
jgi:hypothetical protein